MTEVTPGPGRARGDRAALERLLGGPETAWLVSRVRTRVLTAGDGPLRGVVRLNDPTDRQRAAAVRLVGRPRRAGSALRVDLAAVEEILRRGPWPAGLAHAVETLSGPVVDRAAERAREAVAWDAARDRLLPATARFPGVAGWWQAWCAAGGLKRAARTEAGRTSATSAPEVAAALVSDVAAVLETLPAGQRPLAILARETVGDAHGLDASRPLGRLSAAVVRAAFLPGTPDGESSTRDVWAAAGVVLSNVASTALCLGVVGAAGPGDAGDAARTATATALEAMRAARLPMVLTLDQVRSGGVRAVRRRGVVHVCENPTVVEVVAERWARSAAHGADFRPVLVCTWGQPSAAVVELLRTLAADGAEVRYHGDFDWAGLRIAWSLQAHVPWVPWRYTAADYRAAVAEGRPSLRLTGTPAQCPWDADLAAAMTEFGLAVEEEAVAHVLAADVLAGPGAR